MHERHERLPACAEQVDERGRCDHLRLLMHGSRFAGAVAGGAPAQQLRAEYEPGRALLQNEGAVWKLIERCLVVSLGAPAGLGALGVELRVDRVGSDLPGMKLAPDRDEAGVVFAAAERTGAVAGGERGRLVEEEQLGEASGLHQRPTLPAAELEPAGDPAFAGGAAADPPELVVEAATVSVDQAARWICDQLAQRCHPVLQRHSR